MPGTTLDMSTEELLKQADEYAKSDPKRAEQIYSDVLGELTSQRISNTKVNIIQPNHRTKMPRIRNKQRH